MTSLAFFYWNPSKIAFTIPYINHPIAWYGLLFVTGFFLGYFLVRPLFARFLQEAEGLSDEQAKESAAKMTDTLCWYTVIGTVVGARLGHVFFYDWAYFSTHPFEILKTWNGGLASHGGVLGVMIALYLFQRNNQKKHPSITYLRLLDFIAVPSALVAGFIRLGNFMNQEILGTPTDLPWGVIFGNPEGPFLLIPRHPVQLYEAVSYFLTFSILHTLSKHEKMSRAPGKIIGLLFVLIFGFRFALEFLKTTQESSLNSDWLQAGQLLSIPFIILGFILIKNSKPKIKNKFT